MSDNLFYAFPLKHCVGNNVVCNCLLSEDFGFSGLKELSVLVQLTERVIELLKEADFLSAFSWERIMDNLKCN